MFGQRRRVEPVDPHGEVIHVASGVISRLARRGGSRNQIDQGGAGAQLDQFRLLQSALDAAVQNSFVEIDRAVEVADPQHDVVEAGYADPLPGTHSLPSLDISCVRHCRLLSLAVSVTLPRIGRSRQPDYCGVGWDGCAPAWRGCWVRQARISARSRTPS
jgi:hypothetical protein